MSITFYLFTEIENDKSEHTIKLEEIVLDNEKDEEDVFNKFLNEK